VESRKLRLLASSSRGESETFSFARNVALSLSLWSVLATQTPASNGFSLISLSCNQTDRLSDKFNAESHYEKLSPSTGDDAADFILGVERSLPTRPGMTT
jgi:hypothetical protein